MKAPRSDICVWLALASVAAVALGCSREGDTAKVNSVSPVTSDGASPKDVAVARQHADRLKSQLAADDLTTDKFREIAIDLQQLEHQPALTDLQVSDLRAAADAWWQQNGGETSAELLPLASAVDQQGGRFDEIPISSTVAANFRGTDITDGDLKTLPGLEHVTTLVLWDAAEITDAGLEHVAQRCNRLRVLDLRNTSITDAGLERIERIETLRKVLAAGTRATDNGLARLDAILAPRVEADRKARLKLSKQRQALHSKK